MNFIERLIVNDLFFGEMTLMRHENDLTPYLFLRYNEFVLYEELRER